jgi:hypothetical protein
MNLCFVSLESSFADLMAIFTRAVRATEPSVGADQAQTFAEYILRVCTWEVQIANSTCMATLEANFPSLKARVNEKVRFSVPSVYIGKTAVISLTSHDPQGLIIVIVLLHALTCSCSALLALRAAPLDQPQAWETI